MHVEPWQEPWSKAPLSGDVLEAVRAASGPLAASVVEAIVSEGGVYGQVLSGPEGTGIRIGIEQAIRAFLTGIERGEHPSGETGEIWRRLGEAEFQAGRSLEALRGAFRSGTRAAWGGAARLAVEAGIPTPMVIALAEAIFLYSDELAAQVIEGYVRMQSDEAGELERRRRRLAVLLVEPGGVARDALEREAELARWPLPRELAVLALAGSSPGAARRRLSVEVLTCSDAEGLFLVVPDPEGPGRAGELDRALAGEVAAIGPTVTVERAPVSLRRARQALALAQRGVLPPAPGRAGPVRASDHLTDLLLLADEGLSRELADSRLAALEALSASERDRLLETLDAWLAHQRHTPGVAKALHVHPQTVRYRMARLRELLGEALDSAEDRFELELALRVRRALGP